MSLVHIVLKRIFILLTALTLSCIGHTAISAELHDWDVSATNNNGVPPNGFPENMAYSEVNDAARETMAVIARFYETFGGGLVTGGTGNTYTLTTSQTLSTYATGFTYIFKADKANTGAVTLNVNTLGAQNVVNNADGSALAAGQIALNGVYMVQYDGTQFRLLNSHETAATIKSSYESNADTNAFTDAEQTKLTGIETGATTDQTGSEILAALLPVDGSGSSLDSDTLDAFNSTQFLRSDIGDTYSNGILRFTNDAGLEAETSPVEINGLQVFQSTNNADAMMSFHVATDWGFHFGLDGGLNDLVVAGWSLGNGVKHRIWHAGNDGSGSGLDADTVDTYNTSTVAANNTIAVRDANGYLISQYFNTPANVSAVTASHIAMQTSSDNFIRWQTPAQFVANHGIWTSGNDGAASGLDADTLDGVQGSGYAPSGHSHAAPAFRGALVFGATDTVPTGSVAEIANFPSELYDTDGIHSTTVNTSRLTVPSGVTKVRLSGAAWLSSGATDIIIRCLKNGGFFTGQFNTLGSSTEGEPVSTAIVPVVAGEYFELSVRQSAATSKTLEVDTWFAMEIIE